MLLTHPADNLARLPVHYQIEAPLLTNSWSKATESQNGGSSSQGSTDPLQCASVEIAQRVVPNVQALSFHLRTQRGKGSERPCIMLPVVQTSVCFRPAGVSASLQQSLPRVPQFDLSGQSHGVLFRGHQGNKNSGEILQDPKHPPV